MANILNDKSNGMTPYWAGKYYAFIVVSCAERFPTENMYFPFINRL